MAVAAEDRGLTISPGRRQMSAVREELGAMACRRRTRIADLTISEMAMVCTIPLMELSVWRDFRRVFDRWFTPFLVDDIELTVQVVA